MPKEGHHWASPQAPQAAFLAWHTRRPWKITRWLKSVHSLFGISRAISASTLTGSSSSVHPNRRTSRPKWVSTVSPGTPNALPSTTLAVLRPTPGSVTRSSIRPGTSPSNRSTRAWPSPIREFVFARKKPVGLRIASSSSRSAAGVVRRRRDTREQGRGDLVDHLVGGLRGQDRGDSSSNGVVKSSSQCASGWIAASSRAMRRPRRVWASAVSAGSKGDAPGARPCGRRTCGDGRRPVPCRRRGGPGRWPMRTGARVRG